MRPYLVSLQFAMAMLLGLAACGGDPSGPSTGGLAVTVAGLPPGASASISVTGPEGFSRELTGTQTLQGLSPGSYTIAAAGVTFGGIGYAAVPQSQTVAVSRSETPASVTVLYSQSTGNLAIAVNGLPSGTDASVTVTGPAGFSQTVTGSTMLTALSPGSYTVSAEPVTSGVDTYQPQPSSQNATVAIGATASASVTYTEVDPAAFNLTIGGLYLVQSTQTLTRGVPLVAGRDAYVRVFALANQPNVATPSVKVELFNGALLVATHTISAPALSVPTSIDQSSLSKSWNVLVPASLVLPNLAVKATLDPDGVVAEANESDNVYPASGTPVALDVRAVDPFRVRFVPVRQSGRPALQGNVTDANKDQFLATARKVHPLGLIDANVRAVYTTTTTDTLQDNNANGAWTTILSEVDAIRVADGDADGRYYYGVVRTGYTSGVAGVGYIGAPTAIGWDFQQGGSAGSVAAHEWGHNWNRQHAPCGSPGNLDNSYPYPSGEIGVYGLDLATTTVRQPSLTDLMGYCSPQWISDYTFTNVLNFRASESMVGSAAAESSLLVWGRIVNGEPVLEPAFRVPAPPSLPRRGGPYAVQARADDGSVLFSFSFTPLEPADIAGEGHFAFTVPLPDHQAARLAELRVSGPAGTVRAKVSAPNPSAARARLDQAVQALEVRRDRPDRLRLRWNAAAQPMVLVQHPATGQVLSLARGGEAEVWTDAPEVDLVLSDRVQSRARRVKPFAR